MVVLQADENLFLVKGTKRGLNARHDLSVIVQTEDGHIKSKMLRKQTNLVNGNFLVGLKVSASLSWRTNHASSTVLSLAVQELLVAGLLGPISRALMTSTDGVEEAIILCARCRHSHSGCNHGSIQWHELVKVIVVVMPSLLI